MLVLFLVVLVCRIESTLQNIVITAQGKIRGVAKDGYVAYIGIPYASVSSDPGGRFKVIFKRPIFKYHVRLLVCF